MFEIKICSKVNKYFIQGTKHITKEQKYLHLELLQIEQKMPLSSFKIGQVVPFLEQ